MPDNPATHTGYFNQSSDTASLSDASSDVSDNLEGLAARYQYYGAGGQAAVVEFPLDGQPGENFFLTWYISRFLGFSKSSRLFPVCKISAKKKLSISQSFHKTTAKCAPSLALFPGFRRHAVFMQQNIYSRVYWAR